MYLNPYEIHLTAEERIHAARREAERARLIRIVADQRGARGWQMSIPLFLTSLAGIFRSGRHREARLRPLPSTCDPTCTCA
jgi:hypothetical protein